VKIPPEGEPADASVSASVCTVMPVVLPEVAAPNTKPLRVITKLASEAMPATAVVMTMELVANAEVAVMVATDAVPAALAEGVAVVAKNPDG